MSQNDDTISRQAAYDALMAEPIKWYDSSVWESARCHQWMMDMDVIKALPSTQQDTRLEKIADLVDGSIDHFDLEDAMDLLYQIKDVLNG